MQNVKCNSCFQVSSHNNKPTLSRYVVLFLVDMFLMVMFWCSIPCHHVFGAPILAVNSCSNYSGLIFFVGVQCDQWGQWLIAMVVTIHNGGCRQWWYVFFLVFVMFLFHHVCCVFKLLFSVFSNLCSNFLSLCFCVWNLDHHMLHGPTLVLNSWSSCSWFSAQFLIIMFFVVLLLCFPHGHHVISGATFVLELLVVVFLLVLLGHLNF